MATLLAQAFRLAVNLATTAVLARLLLPNEFGQMAILMVVVGLGEILRDFGFSHAALRRVELNAAQKSNLFWLNSGIGLGCALLAGGLAWPLAQFFDIPGLTSAMLLLTPVFLFNGIATQFRVEINRTLRFLVLSIVDLAPILLGAVVAISAAAAGGGVWALIGQQLTIAAAGLVLSVVLAGWMPGCYVRAVDMSDMLHSGWQLTLTQLLAFLPKNVDTLALGRVWGTAALGYYDRAYQLMIVPVNQISAPLTKVALPTLARVSHDSARLAGALRRAQLLTSYLSVSMYALLAGFAPAVVDILLGSQWQPSSVLLRILCLAGLFRALSQISYWIFVSTGQTASQLRFYAISQPALVIVTLSGVPFGPTGVAWAISIGLVLYWVASVVVAGQTTNIPVAGIIGDVVRVLLWLGAPVFLVIAAVGLLTPDPFMHILLGAAGALVWAAGGGFVSRRVRLDYTMLVEFVMSARRRAG